MKKRVILIITLFFMIVSLSSIYATMINDNDCDVESQKPYGTPLFKKLFYPAFDALTFVYIGDICFQNKRYYIYNSYRKLRGSFHLVLFNKNMKWYIFDDEDQVLFLEDKFVYKNDKIYFNLDIWDIREQLEELENKIKKHPEAFKEVISHGGIPYKWGYCALKIANPPFEEYGGHIPGISSSYSIN